MPPLKHSRAGHSQVVEWIMKQFKLDKLAAEQAMSSAKQAGYLVMRDARWVGDPWKGYFQWQKKPVASAIVEDAHDAKARRDAAPRKERSPQPHKTESIEPQQPERDLEGEASLAAFLNAVAPEKPKHQDIDDKIGAADAEMRELQAQRVAKLRIDLPTFARNWMYGPESGHVLAVSDMLQCSEAEAAAWIREAISKGIMRPGPSGTIGGADAVVV